jgi:arylsulfatase A-like enzyme
MNAASSRPNVLILLADQLRRAALSCYGDPNIQTPNIDALARRGTRFSNACSTYPICVPFRFTFMTGQTAHSRQISSIGDRMSPAERTLADEFNQADYHTCYFGKWHLDGGRGGYLPWGGGVTGITQPIPRSRRGRWEKWFVVAGKGSGTRHHFDQYYFEDDEPAKCVEGYQTDVLFDRTLRYLAEDRPQDKPFCCVLSFSPPHHPYQAPDSYEDLWKDRDLQLPENFMVEPSYRVPTPDWGDNAWPKDRETIVAKLRTYYAMIQNADDNVGKMLEFLQQTGLADNTIILLTSDHGEMGGAHNLAIQAKSYPFEEAVGIPLIVADPRSPDGQVRHEPTCTEDLFPTICALAGIHPRDALPGSDLSPLVASPEATLDRRGVMLEVVHDCRPGFTFNYEYYRAFRSQRYLYAVLGEGPGGDPWLLFDLEKDPGQMNNVLEDPDYAQVATEHHRLLREEMIRTEDHFRLRAALGSESLNL